MSALVRLNNPYDALLPQEHEAWNGQQLRGTVKRAYLVCVAFIGLMILAATVIRTDGAVVTTGEVGVEAKVKKIGHPTGGVVKQILVHEGDKVRAHQPLIVLDDSLMKVNAVVLSEGVEQLLARKARLEAERDGLSSINFPVALTQNGTPSAKRAIASEMRQFMLRRSNLGDGYLQLQERSRQLQSQLTNLGAQMGAVDAQSRLITPEIEGIRTLWNKRLVPLSRVNAAERSGIELKASRSAIESQAASIRSQMAELRQQMSQTREASRMEAGTELAAVEASLADQRLRSASSSDALDRSIIRAPQDGTVSKLAITTIGGVVPAQETVMEIVPNSRLTVIAHVATKDIDQIAKGKRVSLRFSALNAQTTPVVEGVIQGVPVDTTIDPRTGATYYAVKVGMDSAALRQLNGVNLVQGMPVEAMIRTGERSLLSYLFKPLRDQFERALRE